MSTRPLLLALGLFVLGCSSSDTSVTQPVLGVGSGSVPRVEINSTYGYPSVRQRSVFISEGGDVDFVFTVGTGVECGVRFELRGVPVPRNIAVDAGNRTVRRRFLVADYNEEIRFLARCVYRDRLYEEEGFVYVW